MPEKTEWEKLLNIDWPQNACDRSGECCRGAAQVRPWERLLKNAAQGDSNARAFLNQYMPYLNLEEAHRHAPDGVAASLEIVRERGDAEADVVFYHCRFLQGKSDCAIYEDRPALCRDFPESPFGAVPRCCGYASVTEDCRQKLSAMRQELSELKQLQAQLQQLKNAGAHSADSMLE